jgi:ferredoxin
VASAPDPARPLSARPLQQLLREATDALPETSPLRTNLAAVVPMALRLLRAGAGPQLDELLTQLSTALGPELGLGGEESKALRDELRAVRGALPADARLVAPREGLALELHCAAVEAVRAPLRKAFHRRLRGLRERLRDLLQLASMTSREGHTAQRLAAELGGPASRHLDPEALARTLPDRSPGLAGARRERIEQALAVLEAELAEEALPIRVLYFTPPGLELPSGFGLQCEHPDPLAAAVGCFDGAALRLAPLFRAVRIAELELDGRYRPEHHDPLLADLDWQGFTAEELALVPPVAALTSGRRLRQRALGSLSELLRSSRPVHVLVSDVVVTEDEAEDLSRFHLDLGYLVMAHREAFAVASSLARPERLAQALVQMAKAPRPGVAVVHLPSPGLEPWYPLLAEAALQGRACPEFLYDPDAGPSWAGRFDLGTNPQPERAWPLHRIECIDGETPRTLELAFSFADAVALEPACARHFHVIPRVAWDDEIQRPLAEYLDRFDPEGRDRSVPYLWVVDDAGILQRAIVTRALAMAVRDRLRGWRVIQELAGYQNAYAERAAAAAREQALSEAARERSALERAHAEALAGARSEGARESMQRLAAALIRGDGLALAPAPEPAAVPSPLIPGGAPQATPPAETAAQAAPAAPEEDGEAPLLDEPYVDSALCTSCNECTAINGRMFRYNGDKQAFVADVEAGTFAELVKAAELCPARCIHVGRPRSDDATATPELIARAAAFG